MNPLTVRLNSKTYIRVLAALIVAWVISISMTRMFPALILADILIGIMLLPALLELVFIAAIVGALFVALLVALLGRQPLKDPDVAVREWTPKSKKALIQIFRLLNKIPCNPLALGLPSALVMYAKTLEGTGNTIETELLYRESVSVLENQRFADKVDLFTALVLLGQHLSEYGQHTEAVGIRSRAFEISKQIKDAQFIESAAALILLADGMRTDGKVNESATIGKRALEIIEQTPVGRSPKDQLTLLAKGLFSLRDTYKTQGELAKAMSLENRGRAIATKMRYEANDQSQKKIESQ